MLIAKNAQGEDRREFRIVVGDTLALTPPMGWNSWYIHYNRVTDSHHARRPPTPMIACGMADYGYQYVNIDDCWMEGNSQEPEIGGPTRDDDGPPARPTSDSPT